VGQNVRRDKTSRRTKLPEDQMSVGTKHSEGKKSGDIQTYKKNIRRDKTSRDKTSFWLIFNTYAHIKNFNNNTILNSFHVYNSIYMEKTIVTHYNSLKKS
jgi:hypothetical protein